MSVLGKGCICSQSVSAYARLQNREESLLRSRSDLCGNLASWKLGKRDPVFGGRRSSQ